MFEGDIFVRGTYSEDVFLSLLCLIFCSEYATDWCDRLRVCWAMWAFVAGDAAGCPVLLPGLRFIQLSAVLGTFVLRFHI